MRPTRIRDNEMKKILIYVSSAIVLLGIGFFIGFSFCLNETEKEAKEKESAELVESEDSTIEEQPELKALPNMKFLASLMLEEKSTHHFNDAMYVAYLVDSLGFAMDDKYSGKWWWKPQSIDFTGGGMRLRLDSGVSDDGALSRSIRIENCATGRFIYELNQFGLKKVEGEDGFADYEGKGLFAGTSPNSLFFCCRF